MRRRNKPKVVWLPAVNNNSIDTNARSMWSVASVPCPTIVGADATVLETPIVMDGPNSDPLAPNSTLADIESSGYRLRRIVGKLYLFLGQSQTSQVEDLYAITAGFIIRRVDPTTGASLASLAGATEIDPADIDNSMDPWIWRRSWILSNGPDGGPPGGQPSTDTLAAAVGQAGGGSNYGKQYPGGNLEGPHVDQKTARIVGPEERLFLNVSATPLFSVANTTTLVAIYEMRVLASMRTNIGNRRNASR